MSDSMDKTRNYAFNIRYLYGLILDMNEYSNFSYHLRTFSLRNEWCVNCDEVCLWPNFFQVKFLYIEFSSDFSRDDGIITDCFHTIRLESERSKYTNICVSTSHFYYNEVSYCILSICNMYNKNSRIYVIIFSKQT